MRGRRPGRSLSPDPLSVGWTARLPGRRVHLCLGRRASGHAPMARAALSAGLPSDRCHRGARGGRERSASPRWMPFYMVALIFVAAFGTLAISFWPYMIPFSITVEEAAAPHSSLAFMFWGEGLFVFPLMLLYTVISYSVFRGKVRPTTDHY